MARKIKRKAHKITKRRIFKNFRKKHLLRRRTKQENSSGIQESLTGIEQLSNIEYEHTPRPTYARTDNYTYGLLAGKRHNQSTNRGYKKSFARTSFRRPYSHFSSRTDKLRTLKKSIVFLLIGIIILVVANTTLSNIGSSTLNSLDNLIENINVQNFKNAFNNMLPIINVTYNSGNIGNPISVQIKNLIKNIFGFDIGIPLTILNAQSPFLHTYYEDEYILHLAENRTNNEDEEYLTDNEGDNSQIDDSDSPDSEKVKQDDENPDSGENLASRGDNRTPDGRGDNIEEVEDGIISYYYYEGEEEKLEEPKENIASGQKINIMNMTSYKMADTEINKLLKEPLNIRLDRQGPGILILHTHSSESFVKKLDDINVKSAPLSSRNPQENVVRVGHELAEQLKKYGFDVIHNGTEHDIPDHNKSYSNSYETIDKYLKSYPTIKVVLDIHRDGLPKDQPKLRVAKNIDGKNAAQIMFVVGTNANGLQHSKWKENLKLALKLQENLNSQYPGIARHIYISNNRYNQHFTNGSLIIEVGGEGNLLSECLESTKYLAKAISEIIK